MRRSRCPDARVRRTGAVIAIRTVVRVEPFFVVNVQEATDRLEQSILVGPAGAVGRSAARLISDQLWLPA